MPKKVKPSPTGIWKQVARVQRVGLSEGLRGRGGGWLAIGVGAWGLQRLRSMSAQEDEFLIREPLGPGETITITNQTTTRAEAAAAEKAATKARKAHEKKAKKADKAGRRARRRRRKAAEEQAAAAEARRRERAARRRRRRRSR